jgi:hypothetical protein
MTQKKKIKYLAIVADSTMLLFYVLSLAFNDIKSDERYSLQGTKWLLDNASLFYLPLFPFVSLALSGILSNQQTSKNEELFHVGVLNTALTLVFFIFALSSRQLQYTWLFLSLASIIFTATGFYDFTHQQKNNKYHN